MECEQCRSKLKLESFKLGHSNTFLDQTAPETDGRASEWDLTTYLGNQKKPTAFRLCFRIAEECGDPLGVFFMTFKVKPPGATAFDVLGSTEVIPYWFTREAREDPGWGIVDEWCVCQFQ